MSAERRVGGRPGVTRGSEWRNWSGSVAFHPARLARPGSVEEVVALVRTARDAGESLRVVGAGHSFTPLAVTDGTLVSLDGFAGLVAADPGAGRATVRGGTRLREVGDALLAYGAALENLGDIDVQSVVADVIEEVRSTIERRRLLVHFPIEVRFAAGDDLWLSPAYGRDSAYVAVHVFQGMPYREFFGVMEEIFVRAGGRPHWGKLHSLGAAELRPRYPRWDDFLAVRARLDPGGVFLNPHLRRLFGLA